MSVLIKSRFRTPAGELEALPVKSLLKLLGVTMDTNDKDYWLYDARQAWKAKIEKLHPDKGGDAKECARLNQVFQIIERRLTGTRITESSREKKFIKVRDLISDAQIVGLIEGGHTAKTASDILGIHYATFYRIIPRNHPKVIDWIERNKKRGPAAASERAAQIRRLKKFERKDERIAA